MDRTVTDRTVTVAGSATLAVAPDCAHLNCGVQVEGTNAQDALRRSNEAMRAIVDALTAGRGRARGPAHQRTEPVAERARLPRQQRRRRRRPRHRRARRRDRRGRRRRRPEPHDARRVVLARRPLGAPARGAAGRGRRRPCHGDRARRRSRRCGGRGAHHRGVARVRGAGRGASRSVARRERPCRRVRRSCASTCRSPIGWSTADRRGAGRRRRVGASRQRCDWSWATDGMPWLCIHQNCARPAEDRRHVGADVGVAAVGGVGDPDGLRRDEVVGTAADDRVDVVGAGDVARVQPDHPGVGQRRRLRGWRTGWPTRPTPSR